MGGIYRTRNTDVRRMASARDQTSNNSNKAKTNGTLDHTSADSFTTLEDYVIDSLQRVPNGDVNTNNSAEGFIRHDSESSTDAYLEPLHIDEEDIIQTPQNEAASTEDDEDDDDDGSIEDRDETIYEIRNTVTQSSPATSDEKHDYTHTVVTDELIQLFDDGNEEKDEADEYDSSGAETDIEDNVEHIYLSTRLRRESNPLLPETVSVLETDTGCKIYLVGTAHFSEESQEDVSKVIRATQPDIVMVELCASRVNILQLDEETLMEEARNINIDKIKIAIKQNGLVQGILHILLLSMSAHLTKQLGMAPGGEFRRAFREAQKVVGCRIQLGDRPIQVTLRRAFGALSAWQKIQLAWYILTSKEPISKEEVEKCKQKDLLEQILKEMTGEFPGLHRVFVMERDIFLAESLQLAAQPIACPEVASGYIPSVIVGVVGMGHVTGIMENWNQKHNIKEIMTVPVGSMFGSVFKWSFRVSFVGALSWGCYKFFRWSSGFIIHRS